jgi:hypothetical protein
MEVHAEVPIRAAPDDLAAGILSARSEQLPRREACPP